MNITEIKSAWLLYSQKLQTAEAINQKIILSMINERSRSRCVRIKREYLSSFALMTILLILFSAIIIGNPFDFIYPVQYLPAAIYIVIIMGACVSLVKNYKKINVELTTVNLEVFLKEMTHHQRKVSVFKGWKLGLIMISASMLFFMSFLPVIIKNHGWGTAIAETLFVLLFGAGVGLITFKSGLLKNRHGQRFQEDLTELNELKAMTSELVADDVQPEEPDIFHTKD